MATVKQVRDGEWEARWRTPDGKSRRKRGFATKRDALRHVHEVEHTKATGAYIEPGKLTFGEYAEQWRVIQNHRPSTAAQLETNLRRHVLPYLGPRPIGQIKRSEIQAWMKGRMAEVSPGTVQLLLRWVSTIFKAAVLDDLIRKSPCQGIDPPEPERTRVVPMEAQAVRGLVEAFPERYRALVILGAGTGLRQGEAFGLTVDRFDWARKRITVDRQLVLMPGGPPFLGPPKTKASYRTIPIEDHVVTALAEHLRRYPAGPDGFIFTDDAGQPIKRTAFSRDVWVPARKAAGLPETVTFHDLRHFYASALIRRGASVKVVMERMGHTGDETLRTYTHLFADEEDRTRQAIGEALGEVLAGFVSPACHEEGVAE